MRKAKLRQRDRRPAYIGVRNDLVGLARGQDVQMREISRVIAHQERLARLSQRGQNISPVADAFKVQAVALQFAVNDGEKSNHKATRLSRQYRVRSARHA